MATTGAARLCLTQERMDTFSHHLGAASKQGVAVCGGVLSATLDRLLGTGAIAICTKCSHPLLKLELLLVKVIHRDNRQVVHRGNLMVHLNIHLLIHLHSPFHISLP